MRNGLLKFAFILPALLILLALPKSAKAQMLVDLHAHSALPMQQFKQNGFNTGWGFGFGIMSTPLNGRTIEGPKFVQLHAGGSMSFTSFGRKKYELELAAPQSGMADVKVSNIDFILTPTVRAVFGKGVVQPYVDAFGGLHFLSATQTVTPQKYTFNSEYEKETQTNLTNAVTYFAGVSAGMLFKLSESVYVNTGVSYGWGGKGNILPLKNIERNGNELTYNFTKSHTDMLLIKLGFTFKAEPNSDHSSESNYNSSPNTDTRSRPRGKSNEIRKNPQPNVGH